MKNFLRKFKPTSFEDIFAAIALYRPGPMQNIDTYIKRKSGKEKINYYHPSLESILKPTYGILIYQEQIMQVASTLASYSLGEADILRRAMSKKKEEILIKEKDKFIKNATNNGVDLNTAKEVYDLILKFASYGFNRSHSVAYSMIAYKMAYLKAHYRIYFTKNLLNNYLEDTSKKKSYINELRKHNIEVLVPDINISEKEFVIKNNKVVYPLEGIKGVGANAINLILEERNKEEFKDIYDFFKRCYSKAVNKKVVESLIYAGCFDSFNINRNTLINSLDDLINYSEISGGFDDEFNLKPVLNEIEEFDKRELLLHEHDVFGFYFTKHPVSEYKNNTYVELDKLSAYFDKDIKTVVLVDRVKETNTKKNEKMLFITGSDEITTVDLVMFPSVYKDYLDLKVGSVIEVSAHVEKRFDKYQLIISKIKYLK